jgi:hypothetical protein
MFWPLVLHLDRDVPKDLGDSLLSAYPIGWNGHAFLHQPFEWWQTNAFWPNPDSLAFSDAFIGYSLDRSGTTPPSSWPATSASARKGKNHAMYSAAQWVSTSSKPISRVA